MTLMSLVCRFFEHPAGLGGRSDVPVCIFFYHTSLLLEESKRLL